MEGVENPKPSTQSLETPKKAWGSRLLRSRPAESGLLWEEKTLELRIRGLESSSFRFCVAYI